MLKVAFLWHMHQPYYRDPDSGDMILPWVRLHCLKDYYDLPVRVGKYDNLKMTFNLVPSLIEQIDLYCNKETTDRHLELTSRPTKSLTREERTEVFKIFFWANPDTMIQPFPRYRRLYKKLKDCSMNAEMAARTSSVQEVRDLLVWGTLAWVDPILRSQQPFKALFQKGEKFTENDKADLIEAQYKIMGEIIPIYRSLMDEGKIEVSFTPYFHPILPLICDTDSAQEALPGITLPKNRFCHPEDANRQVAMAAKLYQEKFGRKLEGMWPSEGSVSEQMAEILVKNGLKWMASDEQVLYGSAVKSGMTSGNISPHTIFKHDTDSGSINMFFRDHALSDKIGFVYSGWDASKAVNDFISQLHRLHDLLGPDNNDTVIPVILDGENCWEYFPDDGDEFLSLFFERLSSDDIIQTVTMSEACEKIKASPLKRILAGSWINHSFRIWIGHPEDNAAWDLLWKARQELTQFKASHPDYDKDKIANAEKSLLVAEGSDWNWWYGDEHKSSQNEIFDQIYRAHLKSIYTNLGLKIPQELQLPISSSIPDSFITAPEGIVTPEIDGKLTYYYEWLGAGTFNCAKAGGAMHRIERFISNLLYVSDDDYIYFRVDFEKKGFLVDNRGKGLKIEIHNPGQGNIVFSADGLLSRPDWIKDENDIRFALGDIVEIGIKKTAFFPDGKGELFFRIGLVEDDMDIELWPQGDPIMFKVSGPGEEIIWDL
ncbi:MAG: glycoside hydrolase [candidate division Zixibacteria bacterium]|nr:glycoside hydrolase [candidate division Zixibacteria bacterium]